MLSRLLVFALQLLIVTIAVFAGGEIAARVQLIPRALLNLPTVDFSAADTRAVVRIFLVACGLAFLANRLISGWEVFAEPRRIATEIYALVVGVVVAALWLFFLTGINFSPELLLDASLIAVALHLAVFVALGMARGAGARIGGFFASLFGLLKQPAVWAILLFATSPIVVAYAFTQSRDFANWVTNLRLSANLDDELPYVIVNALGDTTFETPIMAQFADGDPDTLYVLERNGRLYRVDYPSGANKTLLLDLRDGVGYVEMENGALGFDLHPEFGREGSPNAGLVYVYYTEYREDGQTNRLNRYDISLADEAARTASALPLIAQRRDNDGYHNGGSVEFGPDGFLYLAVGEASLEECHNRIDCALVGGILRIDVDRRGGAVSRPIARQPSNGETANYFIPLDNPYADRRDALGEFWAHGLRNPFRIAFDPAGGNLWAGDVGSTVWEEINRIERGGNYQFPHVEGREAQEGFARPDPLTGREHGPVLTYAHTAFLRSVIGGIVYRGARVPEARGRYLFLDNYSGQVMTIPATGEATDDFTIIARARDVAQRGPTSFAAAPDGAILITVMGDNDNPTGIVGRLEPADSETARAANAAAAAERAAETGAVVGPEQAASLWGTNCARCHGARGAGDGPDGDSFDVAMPDFTDPAVQAALTDEWMLSVIRDGGQANGLNYAMPPWEGVLSEAEMRAMARHVRTFRPAARARPR